jgi:hypothetical protein
MLSPANGATESYLTRTKAQYRGQAAGSCGSPRLQMRVPVLSGFRPAEKQAQPQAGGPARPAVPVATDSEWR